VLRAVLTVVLWANLVGSAGEGHVASCLGPYDDDRPHSQYTESDNGPGTLDL
jgi:hypothetical protein